MELLSFELMQLAEQEGLSEESIRQIIGPEMAAMRCEEGEDLSWRQLPRTSYLADNIQLLLRGKSSIFFSKIAKRQVSQAYQVFFNSQSTACTLIGKTPNNTIRLEAFQSYEEFEEFSIGSFSVFPLLPISLEALNQLGKSEFKVLMLLVELFIRTYPDPDLDWEPDGELTFDVKELMTLVESAEEVENTDTCWRHLGQLTDLNPVSQSEVETGIALLALKELVAEMEEDTAFDRYYIGNELVWFIRSLAWWDRGFLISDKVTAFEFLLIQASGLFVITIHQGKNFGIVHLSPGDLKNHLRKYIQLIRTNQEIKPLEEPLPSQSQSPKFCHNCGAKLIPAAKFCMSCGTKIQ
jgi:hypothetical protein